MKELSKEKLKKISKLKRKKYRDKEGLVLIEGPRVIKQLLDDGIDILELYVCSSAVESNNGIISHIHDNRCYTIHDSYLKQLSATPSPQKIFALVAAVGTELTCMQRLLYLDGIADPTNVGTIFRSASAFDIDGIVLSRTSCEIFNPKAIRSSVGKVFSVPFIFDDEFDFEVFRGDVIVADMNGDTSIFDLRTAHSSFVVIMGSEAHGISTKINRLSAKRVSIPMRNKLESLNVATAASLFLFWFSKPPKS